MVRCVSKVSSSAWQAGRTLRWQLKSPGREGEVWVDFPFAFNSHSNSSDSSYFPRSVAAGNESHCRNFPLYSVPELSLISENLAEHTSALDAGASRHCLSPELRLLCRAPGTRTFSSPAVSFWKVSVLGTLARMISLSRFYLGTCNPHLSVSETNIGGGHVCFGEKVIELLIWACNYSWLAQFCLFFFPSSYLFSYQIQLQTQITNPNFH